MTIEEYVAMAQHADVPVRFAKGTSYPQLVKDGHMFPSPVDFGEQLNARDLQYLNGYTGLGGLVDFDPSADGGS